MRLQVVKLNNVHFLTVSVTSDVPQGSVLLDVSFVVQ